MLADLENQKVIVYLRPIDGLVTPDPAMETGVFLGFDQGFVIVSLLDRKGVKLIPFHSVDTIAVLGD